MSSNSLVAVTYISSRLKAGNITLRSEVDSPESTDVLRIPVRNGLLETSATLFVPMQRDLLLGSREVQGFQPSEFAGNLSRFKTEAAGEELVVGRFEIRPEELQLVVELEDASVGFVILGDLGSDLPVVQLGRGSQDDVEGGGSGADATKEPRGGRVWDVVGVRARGGENLGGIDEGVLAPVSSPSSVGDGVVALDEVGLGRQPILRWDIEVSEAAVVLLEAVGAVRRVVVELVELGG